MGLLFHLSTAARHAACWRSSARVLHSNRGNARRCCPMYVPIALGRAYLSPARIAPPLPAPRRRANESSPSGANDRDG